MNIGHGTIVRVSWLAPTTPPRPSEISREKLEHIGKVIFDIPFMIQSHAKSMKKILGAV